MIGMFDSGVGGLSVLREVLKILPREDYVYFADVAHCPYGEKSVAYITDRARWITDYLLGRGADIIVIACNTATAAAVSTLRAEYSDKENPDVRERVRRLSDGRKDHVMFIGVEPAIKPAVMLTKSGVVGVLATAGTLSGSKYIGTRDRYSSDIMIVEEVGRGFVEMVESSIVDEKVVEVALRPLLEAGADTIVLGCTHYPFLKDTIVKVAGEIVPGREITIMDPAPAVARQLLKVMAEEGLGSRPAEESNATATAGAEENPTGKPNATATAGAEENPTGKPKTTAAAGAEAGAPKVELVSSGSDAVLKKLYNSIFPNPERTDSLSGVTRHTHTAHEPAHLHRH